MTRDARRVVMKNRVRDDADFGRLLVAINGDLCQARDHFLLVKRLRGATRRYWRAFAQSQTFWHLTRRAHQDAAMFRLCRAYDQNLDALTLRTLLETIRARPSFFTEAAFRARKADNPHVESLAANMRVIRPAQLARDLKSVQQEHDPKVKNLMMWRHKFYAHRDPGKILDEWELEKSYPLTWSAIWCLIERGFRIVNRYESIFAANISSREMVGSDDYLRILKTVHFDAKSKADRWQRAARTGARPAKRVREAV
jgi:hypothetical protein